MSFHKMHGGATHTAEEFILAGMEIYKNIENNRLIAPVMVCFAFAIELFIKSILVDEQIDPGKKHDLGSLFEMLPNEKKEWIHRMYLDLVGKCEIEEFENEIMRWSKSFTEIRYWHDETNKEQAHFDFSNFIPNLAISLNNAYFHTKKFSRFSFPQVVEGHE